MTSFPSRVRRVLQRITGVAALVATHVLADGAGADPGFSLFSPVSDSRPMVQGVPGSLPGMPRGPRLLQVNPKLSDPAPDALTPGSLARLDLLEGQDITVRILEVRPSDSGYVEVSARATTDPDSSVEWVLGPDGLSGVANLSGLGRYEWIPLTPDTVRMWRVPECGSLRCAVPWGHASRESAEVLSPYIARQTIENGVWDPASEPVVVDILVLYTAGSRNASGGDGAIRQRIHEMIEFSNFVFTNSTVGVRLNPLAIREVQYAESGDILTDFNSFASLPEVLALRNNLKADLTYLIVEKENFGFTGVAPVPRPEGSPDGGFATVRRKDGTFDLVETFVHETGHLFGGQHDREHAFDANFIPTPGTFPYSFGYRFASRGIVYHTVMAYDPGAFIPFFSSPNLRFDGVPTGVAETDPLRADNVQTLNRMAPVVARYRTAQSRIEFADALISVSESAGTAMVRLVRTGDLNTATRVTLSVGSASTAKIADYLRPDSLTVSFQTNQATAEISWGLVQDDLV